MLTSQQLLDAGIKPGPLFGKCLKCDTVDDALALVQENKKEKEHTSSKIFMKPGTVWHWLCTNDCLQSMFSIEKPSKTASNSEKRRWIEQGAIKLNGRTDWKPDDEMPTMLEVVPGLWPFRHTKCIEQFDVWELVFFPNAKLRKCTMI